MAVGLVLKGFSRVNLYETNNNGKERKYVKCIPDFIPYCIKTRGKPNIEVFQYEICFDTNAIHLRRCTSNEISA